MHDLPYPSGTLATQVTVLGVLMTCSFVGHPIAAQQVQRDFQPRRVLAAQPAISDAPTKSADDVNRMINPSELVLGVTIGKESRAYPINMLTGPRREIINDQLGGRAFAATW